MKKLLVVFTIAASLFTATTFAKGTTPSIVSQALQTTFADAKSINWTEVNNLYKAEFVSGEQNLTAYFNTDGKLVASARNLTVVQLPILLQADLKNSYGGYTITSPLEVDNESGVTYYVTVESATKTVQLKSTGYGTWSSYQKN